MKRKLGIVLMTFVMAFALSVPCYAASSKKPVVSVSSFTRDTMVVKSSNNTGAKGYQIKYGTKSSLAGAKIINVVTKTNLNKSISGLKATTKYYVKVRAYATVNGKKVYSSWSDKKSCSTKSYNSAYVNVIKINLEKGKKSTNKWDTDTKNYTAPYMAEVKVYGSTGTYTKRQWVKLSYKGKTKYTFVEPSRGKVPFTRVKHNFTFANYKKYCKNKTQEKLLKTALDLYNSGRVIHHSKNPSKGYDCSGFTRYLYDKAGICWLEATPAGQCASIDIKTKKISKLQPGDLLFFDDDKYDGKKIDHAAMYIGNGEFIQSAGLKASGTDGMSIRPLTGKYKERFLCGGRFSKYNK